MLNCFVNFRKYNNNTQVFFLCLIYTIIYVNSTIDTGIQEYIILYFVYIVAKSWYDYIYIKIALHAYNNNKI